MAVKAPINISVSIVDPIWVDPGWRLSACKICQTTIWVDQPLAPEVVISCYPCAAKLFIAADYHTKYSTELFAQCANLARGTPSLVPRPSWAKVFARSDMVQQPRNSADGRLLIHMASYYLDFTLLDFCLQRWPESINALTNDGSSALLYLGYREAKKLQLPTASVTEIKTAPASVMPDGSSAAPTTTQTSRDLDPPSVSGGTTNPLLACLAMLIQAKADVNYMPPDHSPATFLAVSWQCHRALAVLLDAKADATIKTPQGDNALHHAAFYQSPECIAVLINRGVKFRRDVLGGTALHKAVAIAGRSSSVMTDATALATLKALMQAPNAAKHINTVTKPHQALGPTLSTPLSFAAQNGFLECTNYLLSCKANPCHSTVPGTGYTALHIALTNGHMPVVRALVAAGACTHQICLGDVFGGKPKSLSQFVAYGSQRDPRPVVQAFREYFQMTIKVPSKKDLRWLRSIETPLPSAADSKCSHCDKCQYNEKAAAHDFDVALLKAMTSPAKCSNPCCAGLLNKKEVLHVGHHVVSTDIEPRLKKCSRCQQVAYCSKACQREHWGNGHKADCKS